jgi:hypothetical protein
MKGFLLYIIFRKNELKLSNREANPEVSGHCEDGTVRLGGMGEYVAAFLLKRPAFLLCINVPTGLKNHLARVVFLFLTTES